MQQLSKERPRSRIGKALGTAAAALLCLAAFSQPNLAHAESHGGGGGSHGGGGGFHGGGFGGFHGGGFHGGGFGGFHGGGFHGGGFRGREVRGGGFHGGGFRPAFGEFHRGGFHDGRFHGSRFFGGVGWGGYYPYGSSYYDYYDNAQPSYSQTWYYCADPAGYYPYVTQCYTGWQAVSG
jgi:hypothetical protein